MVSTLAMTDALVNCNRKGVSTNDEFKDKLSMERADYLAMLERMH